MGRLLWRFTRTAGGRYIKDGFNTCQWSIFEIQEINIKWKMLIDTRIIPIIGRMKL